MNVKMKIDIRMYIKTRENKYIHIRPHSNIQLKQYLIFLIFDQCRQSKIKISSNNTHKDKFIYYTKYQTFFTKLFES